LRGFEKVAGCRKTEKSFSGSLHIN